MYNCSFLLFFDTGASVIALRKIWASSRQNLSWGGGGGGGGGGVENNKGTDQRAHTRRLISTFVIRLLESVISQLASREISIF